jgi:hypothetical protein
MFEDGIAFDALKDIVGKRELLCVGRDIHARHGEKVEVETARYHPAGPSDVKIARAQWKINRFPRIQDEGRGRFQQTNQTVAPLP